MLGSPGIIYNCTPDCNCFLGMDAITTESSFDLQATWVVDVLGLSFLHVICGCLYNQALADVQSSGAGTKGLYCTYTWLFSERRTGSNKKDTSSCISIFHDLRTHSFNPFTLRAAKRGLTILEIFPLQKHFFENI